MLTWFHEVLRRPPPALDEIEDDVFWINDSNSCENNDAASEDDWDTDKQMCLADNN